MKLKFDIWNLNSEQNFKWHYNFNIWTGLNLGSFWGRERTLKFFQMVLFSNENQEMAKNYSLNFSMFKRLGPSVVLAYLFRLDMLDLLSFFICCWMRRSRVLTALIFLLGTFQNSIAVKYNIQELGTIHGYLTSIHCYICILTKLSGLSGKRDL